MTCVPNIFYTEQGIRLYEIVNVLKTRYVKSLLRLYEAIY